MATTGSPPALMPVDLGGLIAEIQSLGLRVDKQGATTRVGGAGPSDAGMITIEGVNVTVPVGAAFTQSSPYEMRSENGESWAIYKEGVRVASAEVAPRPKFYDLTTDDGIPYWKIALLHLDSLASTVVQTCAYWGTDDQCHFCGIELSLESGDTIAAKRPEAIHRQPAKSARFVQGRERPRNRRVLRKSSLNQCIEFSFVEATPQISSHRLRDERARCRFDERLGQLDLGLDEVRSDGATVNDASTEYGQSGTIISKHD